MAYNTDAAVKITGVTARQVRYWDQVKLVTPALGSARGRGSRRLYSFENLVELRTVARLLKAGVSLQKIRKIVGHIRATREVDRPLATLRFLTDGGNVFVPSTDSRRWEEALKGGQVLLLVPFDQDWSETETVVREIGEASTGQVKVGGRHYTVTYTPDLEDGGWVVECDALPGCLSQGETLSEARRMIRDAIGAVTAGGAQRGRRRRDVAK